MASIARRNGRGYSVTDEAVEQVSLTLALIYTRVSTDEQASEGLSLDAQIADCRRYVAQHGWAIGSEYTDILSGKRDDRPAYQQLLADARRLGAEGRRVVVVVKWLHRFGRRVLERVRCREELNSLGVATHSVAEGGEVSDLVSNILASVAEEEVRQLSERVKATNRHLRANGWAKVGKAPWGYLWRQSTREERAAGAPKSVLDVDPLTAPYAREAFRQVAEEGASIRRVMLWLQNLPSEIRAGRRFCFEAAHHFLRSPTYIARIRDDDNEGERLIPVRWPALISEATWQQTRDWIASHAHMPHQASGTYLATGLLYCPDCGARMRGMASRNNRGCYRKYQCPGTMSRGADGKDCRQTVSAQQVDSLILGPVSEIVTTAMTTDPAFRQALEAAWGRIQRPAGTDDVAQRVRHLESVIAQARQRLADAAIMLVDRAIDKEGYQLLRDRVQADLVSADAELARLRVNRPTPNLPPLDSVIGELGDWASILRRGGVAEQRAVLSDLVDRASPVRVARGKYRVEITWTVLGRALSEVSQATRPAATA